MKVSTCTRCLAACLTADFLANDHLCNACANEPVDYPLASQPHGEAWSPQDLFGPASTGLGSASVPSPHPEAEEEQLSCPD